MRSQSRALNFSSSVRRLNGSDILTSANTQSPGTKESNLLTKPKKSPQGSRYLQPYAAHTRTQSMASCFLRAHTKVIQSFINGLCSCVDMETISMINLKGKCPLYTRGSLGCWRTTTLFSVTRSLRFFKFRPFQKVCERRPHCCDIKRKSSR